MTHDLRRWMRLIETALSADALRPFVEKIRAQCPIDSRGHCEGAAADLADLLTTHGHQAVVISGRYAKPFHWPEGDVSPMSGHTWVKAGPWILDPTREQFGSSAFITREDDPDAAMYHADDQLVEKVVYRDSAYTVAINPTKREFFANFATHGAAGVLTDDGLLVVGNGAVLDHLSLMRMASVDADTEKYRLQIYNGRVEVELWDDDIEDTANPEPTTKYPKALRDVIRTEVAANRNVRALGWPVVISLLCDGDSILREGLREEAQLIEADFDPTQVERHKAAFLFANDRFLAVPYQRHLETLSDLLNIAIPHHNDWGPREAWYDKLNAIAAQRGWVQGDFMPGSKSKYSTLVTSMSLKGTLPACRQAFVAFRALYPKLLEQVDWVSLEVIGKDGKRTSAVDLRDNQIDRRLARRGVVR